MFLLLYTYKSPLVPTTREGTNSGPRVEKWRQEPFIVSEIWPWPMTIINFSGMVVCQATLSTALRIWFIWWLTVLLIHANNSLDFRNYNNVIYIKSSFSSLPPSFPDMFMYTICHILGLILDFHHCHVTVGKKKSTISFYWLLVEWYKQLRTKFRNFIWNFILTSRKGKPSHLSFSRHPTRQTWKSSTPWQLFQLICQMALQTHTQRPVAHKSINFWRPCCFTALAC